MNCPNCGAVVHDAHCEYCGSQFNQILVSDSGSPIELMYRGKKYKMFITNVEEEYTFPPRFPMRSIDGTMYVEEPRPYMKLKMELIQR